MIISRCCQQHGVNNIETISYIIMNYSVNNLSREKQVPSLVDGEKSNLVLVSHFVYWDSKPQPKTQKHSLIQDTFSFHPLLMEPPYSTTTNLRGSFDNLFLLLLSNLDVYFQMLLSLPWGVDAGHLLLHYSTLQ